MGLQDGRLCEDVAASWREFYMEFLKVHNLPKDTPEAKIQRMTALCSLTLPPAITMDYFSEY